jgi:ABC-type phosphate transport system auxiliary subunit
MRVELLKAQSDLVMVQSVGKLQKKMSEMKDREISVLKEQVAELDKQLKSKREDTKQEVDSESIEMLRAKLTSLSFLNQQGAEL